MAEKRLFSRPAFVFSSLLAHALIMPFMSVIPGPFLCIHFFYNSSYGTNLHMIRPSVYTHFSGVKRRNSYLFCLCYRIQS